MRKWEKVHKRAARSAGGVAELTDALAFTTQKKKKKKWTPSANLIFEKSARMV